MRTGVGIKNKVLEAWACGRPVVMTRLATNGLTLPPGHEGLVQDGARQIAEAVIRLLQDPARRRLGAAARAHVAALIDQENKLMKAQIDNLTYKAQLKALQDAGVQ